jgi:hypothetical protein
LPSLLSPLSLAPTEKNEQKRNPRNDILVFGYFFLQVQFFRRLSVWSAAQETVHG